MVGVDEAVQPGAPTQAEGQPLVPRAQPPASTQPDELVVQPQVIPVGKWLEGIAWNGDALWVAESGQRRLASVNPDTGQWRGL